MTEPIHVPAFGPRSAEYAAIGQSPGRREGEAGRPFVGPAGSLAREWLQGAGIDPDSAYYTNVYEYVLVGGEAPTTTDVKHGIERVMRELAGLPNLRAVILFGSYAARMAFSLKGGITRAHGRQGTLALAGREVPCIACLHPSYVLRQTVLRVRQQLDNECRSAVARLPILDQPMILPTIRLRDGARVSGEIGLDTETAMQVGKRPDPRRDPLLLTGLNNGTVVIGSRVWITSNAEPVVHNVPFDPVVLGTWDAQWHDSKVLAHLCGESDTTMKGLATRLLNRPMMEYDPDLRAQAADAIARGDWETGAVRTFAGYCVQDAVAHRDLLEALRHRADTGTCYLYETVERPMLRLYAKWTLQGVFRVDRDAALTKRDQLDGKIRDMRRDLKAATGVESPHAHGKLALALGMPSTSAVFVEQRWTYLTQRQRDVLRLIGRLRSLERQVSTYIDAWLGWDDLPLLSTIWRPTAAWTGRPGSADLNLQNIPGPCGDCRDCRKDDPMSCAFNLKPLLLPPDGSVLYELDNSQAELRVAAHLSQDEAMIAAFTEGIEIDGERQYDLHTWAQHKLGIASRRDAKIRVLATFYGQSEEGVRAAPELQQAIRRTFRGYVAWSQKVKRLSIVPGLFGRRLFVPPHPNQGHREREAINAPSQGGAVDVLKLQTLALDRAGLDTRHMIHDSVIVRVPDAEAGSEIEHYMMGLMEGAVELSVPLRVEVARWPAH